jgi:hypothetical protein
MRRHTQDEPDVEGTPIPPRPRKRVLGQRRGKP